MKEPKEVLHLFEPYAALVEKEIRRILDAQPRLAMYDMMRYFFGFADERGNLVSVYGGKRFRSGLCLLLADAFGVLDEQAVKTAAALEVFHNFTLIHDDIEDRDEYRRGRTTVWKLWGINHGINAGDGQLILAHMLLSDAAAGTDRGAALEKFLQGKFLEVIEGQFLDFTLTEAGLSDAFVNQEYYMNMVAKKTSALVGAASKAAGILANVGVEAEHALWTYGTELGFAYQICDDMVSIWGDRALTGKTAHNDMYEKKKTPPVLYARDHASPEDKATLADIYSKKGNLSPEEVLCVIELLDKTGSYEYAREHIEQHAKNAKNACRKLAISSESQETLCAVVDALLPEVKK